MTDTTTDTDLDDTGVAPIHFDLPEPEPEPQDSDRIVPFTLGDDTYVFTARRPKAAVLVPLVRRAESEDETQMALLCEDFIDAVLVPESRTYLRKRLQDPDSTWDYDVLVPVIEALTAQWFQRPTRRSSGSARRPSSRGKRSTAKRR